MELYLRRCTEYTIERERREREREKTGNQSKLVGRSCSLQWNVIARYISMRCQVDFAVTINYICSLFQLLGNNKIPNQEAWQRVWFGGEVEFVVKKKCMLYFCEQESRLFKSHDNNSQRGSEGIVHTSKAKVMESNSEGPLAVSRWWLWLCHQLKERAEGS